MSYKVVEQLVSSGKADELVVKAFGKMNVGHSLLVRDGEVVVS